MCRKLFFLTSFVLVLALAGTNVVFGAVIERRIATETDDVEEDLNPSKLGEIDDGSSDLELAYEDDNMGDPQLVGLRYTDITIEPGSTIVDAWVRFQVDETKSGTLPVNLLIQGELSPNPGTFVGGGPGTFDISNRPRTVASVQWSVPNWENVGDSGPAQTTVNIAAVIQEIINQPGWASGNALVLIFSDDPANPSTGIRCAEAGVGDDSALLHIETVKPVGIDIRIANGNDDVEQHLSDGRIDSGSSDLELAYEDAGTPTTDEQVIGLRFVNLAVPQGTLITSAYIEFEVDKFNKEGSQAPVNLVIEGELTPDAPEFTSVANNVTDRIATTAKAKWSIPPWTEQNVKFQTSDISAVIQEIVNQPGWASGNALVLMLRDDKDNPSTGLREAESFNGESKAAPLLHIEAVIDIAMKPDPANGAKGVLIGSTLSWSPIPAGASRDVYFGTSSPPAFIGNQEATTFYPGPVEPGTTYYWRIDEVEADGTTVHTGDVWSFTTGFSNLGVDKRIATDNDDVEESVDSGSIDMGSSDLEMPYEGTGQSTPQVIGLRYTDIAIPKGIAISGASVMFRVDETKGGTDPVNLIIEGELSADAAAFSSAALNVTSRARTTAQVQWSVPNWTTGGDEGPDQTTPDITSIIQEIVNQDGWVSGNALVLIISDDPSNPSTGVRCAATSPLLHIEASVEAATQPNPADGAENVPIAGATLSWWPGLSAATHDVYFGASSPPALIGNQAGISYDTGLLRPSTTYYWQIDEVEADGTTVHTGNIWSFTTELGSATQPDPANNAVGVALDKILSWSPGVTAATHDVYFGTTSPPAFIGNQAEGSFNPGPLELDTTYYWQIDEIEADGTTKYTGDIWSFKTSRPGTGTILREVWENIGSGNAVSNLTGNENYPANPSYSEEVTLFEAPTDFADNFGSRLHGWLHPDTSGDYTFWIATDDNSELWLSTDESPANAVLISYVTNWAGPRDFDDPDVFPSGPIYLEGGQKYYIMALYKEGGGGDNCAVAWQGPDSPTRAVIDGYYLSPFVNLWAWAPSPADGATDVVKLLTLSWMPGINAISHDVYFGDSSPPPFIGNQTETSYSAGMLEKGKTYYWRVDEVTDTGVLQGVVWSFTVTTAGR